MGSACTAERSSTMSGCCPEGSYGNPPFPGYSWNDKGVVDQVGDMKMYRTGCSPKCIIWCYDIYGFEVNNTLVPSVVFCVEFPGRALQAAVRPVGGHRVHGHHA